MVSAYWYQYEFAKSRGMIHWHGLCWRASKEPHALLCNAVLNKLPDDDAAAVLNKLPDDDAAAQVAKWAQTVFCLTAVHPAGKDENGMS